MVRKLRDVFFVIAKAALRGGAVALIAAVLAAILPAMGFPATGAVILIVGVLGGIFLAAYTLVRAFRSRRKERSPSVGRRASSAVRSAPVKAPGGTVGQFALRLQSSKCNEGEVEWECILVDKPVFADSPHSANDFD